MKGIIVYKFIKQILRFGIVGMLCFVVDYVLLIALTEIGQLNYLLSNSIAFSVSVILNYFLSIRFVFRSEKNTSKIGEFVLFVILSLIGLGLNEILLWLIVEKFNVYYMIAKVIATGIVMVYNFINRKILMDGRR